MEKHAEHYNKRRTKSVLEYHDLTAECKTAECGACANGELVKTPTPNGKYFMEWHWEVPWNPGKKVRPLPPYWGTGGSRPLDIREGDVYVDGKLVKRVSSDPNRGRGYFNTRFRKCEGSPNLHPCEVPVCMQYQAGLRECAGLDDRIQCDSNNLARMIEGSRICKENGETYFVPVPDDEYGQGLIEVPETPIQTIRGKPEKD